MAPAPPTRPGSISEKEENAEYVGQVGLARGKAQPERRPGEGFCGVTLATSAASMT